MKNDRPRPRSAADAQCKSVHIEWVETDPGPCVCCSCEVRWGPVGFKTDKPAGPLCDGCTLRLNKHLGMLLIMAHVNRELASQAKAPAEPQERKQQMVALMVASRIYDQGAEWPQRRVEVLDFVRELQQLASQVPLSAWLKLEAGSTH